MSARTERQREDAHLLALAFNEPGKIDKALPKAAATRPARRKAPWWGVAKDA